MSKNNGNRLGRRDVLKTSALAIGGAFGGSLLMEEPTEAYPG
jgi:hypothetical protein